VAGRVGAALGEADTQEGVGRDDVADERCVGGVLGWGAGLTHA